jgi:hypothetical protein
MSVTGGAGRCPSGHLDLIAPRLRADPEIPDIHEAIDDVLPIPTLGPMHSAT